MNPKIKLLIVDDSIFMRQALAKIFSQPDIEIVGFARNGKEAVEMAAELSPDVITMDIEMPVMNGLEALAQIMKENPIPVLMVSTLTSEGAEATIEALSLGAVDFVTKKSSFTEMTTIKEELLSKVRNIAKNSEIKNRLIRRRLLQKAQSTLKSETTTVVTKEKEAPSYSNLIVPRQRPTPSEIDVLGIGISTGGPAALQEVFSSVRQSLSFPILIVQHMPPLFTKSLAKRLDGLSVIRFKEAENMDLLENGCAYIGPGGYQMSVNKQGRIVISDEPRNLLFKPSADVMFTSIGEIFGSHTVGIIMTGMGNDGTQGLKVIHEKGGYVVAQTPESCVVAGMPSSVINSGIANEVVPLKEIPNLLHQLGGVNH